MIDTNSNFLASMIGLLPIIRSVYGCFVDQIDLPKLGFVDKILKSEGRPAFTNQLMLKIYIYGYFNGIRSSRRLETECCRNIELQWLTANLQPNYHSIADFKNKPFSTKSGIQNYLSFSLKMQVLLVPSSSQRWH
ncbi:MAG: transposase [Bacteroidetes bacterium]|nr:transposase [Bacteroidota bacterium]